MLMLTDIFLVFGVHGQSWKLRIINAGSLHDIVNNTENNHEKENSHPNVAIVAEVHEEKLEKGGNYQRTSDRSSLDISSMKVSELREHLRLRNLDDKGLKKDLQQRLQEYIEEKNMLTSQSITTDTMMIPVTKVDVECGAPCSNEEVDSKVERLSHDMDHSMTETKSENKTSDHLGSATECAAKTAQDKPCDDIRNEDISMESVLETANTSTQAKQKTSSLSMDAHMEIEHNSSEAKEMEPAISESLPSKSPKKQNLGKKIVNLFSPNKLNSSSSKEDSIQPVSDLKNEGDDSGPHSYEKKSSHPSNDLLQPVQNSAGHSVTMTNGTTSQTSVPRETAEPTSLSNNESLIPDTLNHDMKEQEYSLTTPAVPIKVCGKTLSSTAQAKKKEIDEARKARLEKIRNKVSRRQVLLYILNLDSIF
jgi:SAP domain.